MNGGERDLSSYYAQLGAYYFLHDDTRYLALVQKIGRPPAN
jgi:hypothetical protein